MFPELSLSASVLVVQPNLLSPLPEEDGKLVYTSDMENRFQDCPAFLGAVYCSGDFATSIAPVDLSLWSAGAQSAQRGSARHFAGAERAYDEFGSESNRGGYAGGLMD